MKREDVAKSFLAGNTNALVGYLEDVIKALKNCPADLLIDNDVHMPMDMMMQHYHDLFNGGMHPFQRRTLLEVDTACDEYVDRLWAGRSDGTKTAPMKKMIAKYGIKQLNEDIESDFNWGMVSGKVSALRWILGEEWDFLDS